MPQRFDVGNEAAGFFVLRQPVQHGAVLVQILWAERAVQ